MMPDTQSRHLRFRCALELSILALLTGIFLLLFPERPVYMDIALALLALLLLAGNAGFTQQFIWGRYPMEGAPGERFPRSLIQSLAVTAPVTLLLFGIGLYLGHAQTGWEGAWQRVLNPNLLIAIGIYFPWALLQQTLFQFYLLGRLLILVPHRAAIIITGIAYALVHLPDVWITLATAATGVVWTWLYYRHRVLIPLALSHAILGSTFYYWLYGHDLLDDWQQLLRQGKT